MTASKVSRVRTSSPPITIGASMRSDCICWSRTRSSSRSDVPGAYDFTGSFWGGGGRKRPGAADIGDDCRLENRVGDAGFLRGRGLGDRGGLGPRRDAPVARAPAAFSWYSRACAYNPHPGWGSLPAALAVEAIDKTATKQYRGGSESRSDDQQNQEVLRRRSGDVRRRRSRPGRLDSLSARDPPSASPSPIRRG